MPWLPCDGALPSHRSGNAALFRARTRRMPGLPDPARPRLLNANSGACTRDARAVHAAAQGQGLPVAKVRDQHDFAAGQVLLDCEQRFVIQKMRPCNRPMRAPRRGRRRRRPWRAGCSPTRRVRRGQKWRARRVSDPGHAMRPRAVKDANHTARTPRNGAAAPVGEVRRVCSCRYPARTGRALACRFRCSTGEVQAIIQRRGRIHGSPYGTQPPPVFIGRPYRPGCRTS